MTVFPFFSHFLCLFMTRLEFLNIQFKILPYLTFSRGPSTKDNESFHVDNSNLKKNLNFWYTSDDTVDVSLYDSNETNPFKNLTTVLNNTSLFSQDLANQLVLQYLTD